MLNTQTEMMPESYGQMKPGESQRLRDLSGAYYRFLGWIDLTFSAIALGIWYWTGHFSINFAFIFWFWLGSSLKRGNPTARKWAIAIPCLMAITIALGTVFQDLELRITPWGIDRRHSAFIPYAIVSLVVFSIPAIMLRGVRGRQAFTEQKEGEQVAPSNGG